MFTSHHLLDPYKAPVGRLGNFTDEETEKGKGLDLEGRSFSLSPKFRCQR